jgi:hypothetical protein
MAGDFLMVPQWCRQQEDDVTLKCAAQTIHNSARAVGQTVQDQLKQLHRLWRCVPASCGTHSSTADCGYPQASLRHQERCLQATARAPVRQ